MALTNNDLLIPILIYFALIVFFIWFLKSRGISWIGTILGAVTFAFIIIFGWWVLSGPTSVNIDNRANPFVTIGYWMILMTPFFIVGAFGGIVLGTAIYKENFSMRD